MDYRDKINQENKPEDKVSEPYAADYSVHRKRRFSHVPQPRKSSLVPDIYTQAQEFASRNFDEEFVQQLKAENFLIDASCANDDAEEFQDIEKMYEDAESSGGYTQDEAEQFFAIWKQEG